MAEQDRRARVAIERVTPQVDGGRFPVKRVLGGELEVEAFVFIDGQDAVQAVLQVRTEGEKDWEDLPMHRVGPDRWAGRCVPGEVGRYAYRVVGWPDRFQTWLQGLRKRLDAGLDGSLELSDGVALLHRYAETSDPPLRSQLMGLAERLPTEGLALLDENALAVVSASDPRRLATVSSVYEVVVDPARAAFSAWYELFPRSASPDQTRVGTLRDVQTRLAYVAELGFDTLYLPPIHPIGRVNRKGRNNRISAEAGDVGSPWAIGSEEGGHTSLHPELGSLDDLDRLVEAARGRGIEIALDMAFQCAPDHPWVKAHPDWFARRGDGSIKYAENPPKKYQDIFPFDFETNDWRGLWDALRDVFLFWGEHGVRTFRVDNPHTKPFPFWEWCLREVKRVHPDAVFLSEAFTRPLVAERLAKVGFTQSYDYFPWKNTKGEIEAYFSDLSRNLDFLRPSSWINTPDILSEYLQLGGRPAATVRLVLAATLSANYGVYGPVFELGEVTPREPDSEEYLDSEKYEVRHWMLEQPHSLRRLVRRVNRIRQDHPALQRDGNLRFHNTSDDAVICFTKSCDEDVVLVVANVDPTGARSAWIELDTEALGLDTGRPYQVHDMLGEERFLWSGARNLVQLDPRVQPAKIFRIRHRIRSEADFEYYT
ncbi:MAG: alpha-1,4-glucan--maltose-1-phosphate maltosyltransferase [Myxococcota bacterium]